MNDSWFQLTAKVVSFLADLANILALVIMLSSQK